jgi:A-macroglobulin complement component/A-macroglobulin receptor
VTYPNILILDYLKRTKKATPEVQMKAEQLISLGYQRTLTFETPGGGFDWFGRPPAKTVLTAYGLMELADMARVAYVDAGLIQRARSVLLERQAGDGSWRLDREMHTWAGVDGTLPVTAYVTWALSHAGATGGAVDRGLDYLEFRLDERTDPYILALAANAFAAARPRSGTTRRLLDLLDRRKTAANGAASWDTEARTLTYGGDEAASIETTALAAQAFLRAGYHTETATRALTYLVRQRNATGAWSTTQATILALQALLAASEGVTERGTATVRVRVNGREAAVIPLTESNSDVMQQVDLTPYLGGKEDQVRVAVEGSMEPLYQLVTRAYVPWRETRAARKQEVEIQVAYDRTTLRQNDTITAEVKIRSNAAQTLSMLIADIGLAPGFTPEPESLAALTARGVLERYEITPRQLILYLRDLPPGQTARLPVRLRARFPVRAKTPPSVVYEYYRPGNRQVSPPAQVRVTSVGAES